MINNQVPMLLFLKNFRRKICRKYWHLLLKQLLLFAKIDHNFGFLRKNYIFSPKNWRKSQKIVIITSTPGRCYSYRPKFSLKEVSITGMEGQSCENFQRLYAMNFGKTVLGFLSCYQAILLTKFSEIIVLTPWPRGDELL
jgi:hypothetical protein